MEYELEEYINKIRHKFKENPEEVNNELKKVINNLEHEKKDNTLTKIAREVNWDILLVCVLGIMIASLGLFSGGILLYLFGLVFFFAGVYMGLFVKGFGVLFLFSHGMTGLCFMEGSIIAKVIENPRFTDGYNMLYIYAGIVILIFAVATVITMIHNFSDTARKIKWFKVVPVALYFLGFLLSIIFVHSI